MTAAVNQTIKLKDVVYEYSEVSKQSDAAFLRLWRIAFRGYQQMGLNGFFPPTRVTVSVNTNNTVSFPNNLIKFLWVHPLETDGLPAFKKADKITRQNEFTIDNGTRSIKLHTELGIGTVEIECLLAPEQDDDFVIPMEYHSAMMAFLSWQDVAFLPSSGHFGNNDKRERARIYRAQLSLAKGMYKPVLPEEMRNYKKGFF